MCSPSQSPLPPPSPPAPSRSSQCTVYSIIIYIYYNTQKDILFIRGDWNAKVGSQ